MYMDTKSLRKIVSAFKSNGSDTCVSLTYQFRNYMMNKANIHIDFHLGDDVTLIFKSSDIDGWFMYVYDTKRMTYFKNTSIASSKNVELHKKVNRFYNY